MRRFYWGRACICMICYACTSYLGAIEMEEEEFSEVIIDRITEQPMNSDGGFYGVHALYGKGVAAIHTMGDSGSALVWGLLSSIELGRAPEFGGLFFRLSYTGVYGKDRAHSTVESLCPDSFLGKITIQAAAWISGVISSVSNKHTYIYKIYKFVDNAELELGCWGSKVGYTFDGPSMFKAPWGIAIGPSVGLKHVIEIWRGKQQEDIDKSSMTIYQTRVEATPTTVGYSVLHVLLENEELSVPGVLPFRMDRDIVLPFVINTVKTSYVLEDRIRILSFGGVLVVRYKGKQLLTVEADMCLNNASLNPSDLSVSLYNYAGLVMNIDYDEYADQDFEQTPIPKGFQESSLIGRIAPDVKFAISGDKKPLTFGANIKVCLSLYDSQLGNICVEWECGYISKKRIEEVNGTDMSRVDRTYNILLNSIKVACGISI